MRIGITTFGGDGGKSGISQYIINLLRELESSSGEVDFEVFVFEDERDLFVPAGSRMSPLTFGARLRNPIVNVAWHQTLLPVWCWKRKFDVLFLPAANRRLPLWVPCPTVGTVHDFSSLHVAKKYDPARMFYIKHVLPLLIRRLTRVLTVSESSKLDIVEHAGVPEGRVVVTPLAADPRVYYPRNREECVSRVGPKYGIRPPYILYVSRIEHPGKNHVNLIRAFSGLKQWEPLPHQLVLAGSDWTRAEEVHRVAEESGVSREILFTGFVPSSDIPDLYGGADLFVFPSLYEGFGLPVLEAMSCGIPVACSNLSSIPEVAGDAGALFDPYDEKSIEEAMRSILTDEARGDRCSARGLERSGQFTWRNTAARTLQVLNEVGVEHRE